jgi:hypothetical protein
MKHTAAEIGLNPDDFKGKAVMFADYHGRMTIGYLENAQHTSGAAYATLTTTDDRSRSVFADTVVDVADAKAEPT